jgi:hypothetical protein
MAKDTSRSRINSATTYKLYIISCVILASGAVLLLKFPEMHTLEAGTDPLSLSVYGLSIKAWKLVHLFSSLAFMVLTVLHIYFNREWIQKIGSKKLNLNVLVGLLLGVLILLAGVLAPSA